MPFLPVLDITLDTVPRGENGMLTANTSIVKTKAHLFTFTLHNECMAENLQIIL